MRRKWMVAAAVAAVVCVTASVAWAAHERRVHAQVVAEAPGARAAALVNITGGFERVVGFKAIRNPSAGKFCLKLPPSIDPATMVPVVSGEHNGDALLTATVQWDSLAPDCAHFAGNWVEVVTILNKGAQPWPPYDEPFSIEIP